MTPPRNHPIHNHLPTLQPVSPGGIALGYCPFHMDLLPTLAVQFALDQVRCLVCGYAGTVQKLERDLSVRAPLESGRPPGGTAIPWPAVPNDHLGFLISKEVSAAIYHYIFMGKVQKLSAAVARLQALIARMKL